MLFVLPLFEVDGGYYGELSSLDAGGLEMLHTIASVDGPESSALENAAQVPLAKDRTHKAAMKLAVGIHRQYSLQVGDGVYISCRPAGGLEYYTCGG